MDSLPEQGYLKFHPDTIRYVRSQFNLDKPGEMDRAIDILENWLKKQNHFTVKTFPRDFLERQIILDKGSVERTKKQMETLFTMKTVITTFSEAYDVNTGFEDMKNAFPTAMMPKLTKDHHRVYISKVVLYEFEPKLISQYYQYAINSIEYVRAKDYCNGFIAIFDYSTINVLDLVSKMSVTELRQILGFVMQGYQMRLKALHIITNSKAVDVLVKILKQIFSEKVGNRIHVHKTLESLHEQVSKDCLPKELGGEQKSLYTLSDEFADELGKKENVEYFRAMSKAVVDESLRLGERTSYDDLLGISGSFRSISVD